jgi:hypothetical protein
VAVSQVWPVLHICGVAGLHIFLQAKPVPAGTQPNPETHDEASSHCASSTPAPPKLPELGTRQTPNPLV